MTIAVELGRKATKQTNKLNKKGKYHPTILKLEMDSSNCKGWENTFGINESNIGISMKGGKLTEMFT